jgi:predicted nucleotidyltransferase
MRKLAITRKKVDASTVEREIQAAVATIVGSTAVQEIYMFGSAAEDEMTEDSDIDILLVFSGEQQLRQGQKNLGSKYPLATVTIDLVWMTADEFCRKREIGGVAYTAYKLGRRLYDRGTV